MAIYHKYNGHCAYCGKKIKYHEMQVDHINAKALGGTDDLGNLNPACRRCNHYKSTMDIDTFRHAIAMIPVKLMRDSYIFKVGYDFGFWGNRKRKVKFYFEKFHSNNGK